MTREQMLELVEARQIVRVQGRNGEDKLVLVNPELIADPGIKAMALFATVVSICLLFVTWNIASSVTGVGCMFFAFAAVVIRMLASRQGVIRNGFATWNGFVVVGDTESFR